MLLSGLSQRLQGIIGKLRGRGRLSEADIKAALKDIKLALLSRCQLQSCKGLCCRPATKMSRVRNYGFPDSRATGH